MARSCSIIQRDVVVYIIVNFNDNLSHNTQQLLLSSEEKFETIVRLRGCVVARPTKYPHTPHVPSPEFSNFSTPHSPSTKNPHFHSTMNSLLTCMYTGEDQGVIPHPRTSARPKQPLLKPYHVPGEGNRQVEGYYRIHFTPPSTMAVLYDYYYS
jgi:hypothetical protein